MKEFDDVSKEVAGAYSKALKQFGDREYVTAVDIGNKYSEGKKTDIISIRIHVKEKMVETALESSEIFPKDIDGVPVDVIEATYEANYNYDSVVSISDRRARFDRIQPGISVGHYSISAGTLGLLVKDNISGKPAILSNWHVLCGGSTAQIGDPILQPGRIDNGNLNSDTIAFLERWLLNEKGDAAIALLNDKRKWRGQQYGTEEMITGIRNPRLNDILVKSGRTTGVTYGKVDGFGRYFITYSVGRIGIDGFKLVARKPGNPDNEEISSGGDSGSCWYAPETHEGVGLHFGGETDTSPQSEHAIACYLPRVFEALNISLLQSAESLTGFAERLDAEITYNPMTGEFPPKFESLDAETAAQEGVVYERILARWRDPFTPPQGPKMTCVKWVYFLGEKIGIGYKYEWRYIEFSLRLRVQVPTASDLKNSVENVLKEGAVAAALAALLGAVAGGPSALGAAKASFVAAFNIALVKSVSNASVALDQNYSWTPWQ